MMGYHIVGTRHDGSQLVLESCTSEASANRRHAELAGKLEDYSEITVEREKPANKVWDRRGGEK